MAFLYSLNHVIWTDCNGNPFHLAVASPSPCGRGQGEGDFFLKRLENKQSWLLWQKIFSLLGIAAVLAADVLMVMAYL